jgi:RING-like zinc finger
MKVGFFDQSWVRAQQKKSNPQKFTKALAELLAVSNPYGTSAAKDENCAEIECCICINAIAPFQALFISPCSHIYHHKCVAAMINHSPMFQCPLCRQVANLTASVSSESLHSIVTGVGSEPVSPLATIISSEYRLICNIN